MEVLARRASRRLEMELVLGSSELLCGERSSACWLCDSGDDVPFSWDFSLVEPDDDEEEEWGVALEPLPPPPLLPGVEGPPGSTP